MLTIISSPTELFRKGVIYCIQESVPSMDIEECEDWHNLQERLQNVQPYLVIVDMDSEGNREGIDFKTIMQAAPSTKLMTFSLQISQEVIHHILELQVDSHLLKDVRSPEIDRALQELSVNNKYYDQRVLQALLEDKGKGKSKRKKMSKRQMQVLQLVCEEYTNKEIAEVLNISQRTVDGHRYRLIKRFGVKNTAGLIRYAISNRLVDAKRQYE